MCAGVCFEISSTLGLEDVYAFLSFEFSRIYGNVVRSLIQNRKFCINYNLFRRNEPLITFSITKSKQNSFAALQLKN